MSNYQMKNISIVAIICGLILLPTLYFPINQDTSIFALGGKTIADGGQMYVDYLDLKPPGIYLIYAVFAKTIGISVFALRGFDWALQLTASLMIFAILRDRFKKPVAGAFAAVAYSMLYAVAGYSQTLQVESFTGIGICAMFLLSKDNPSIFKYALIGFIGAVLFSLKFTLGVVGAAFLAYFVIEKWRDRTGNRFWSNLTYIFIGSVAGLIVGFFPLLHPKTFLEFTFVMKFLSHYASQNEISFGYIKYLLNLITDLLSSNLSLVFCLAAALGAAVPAIRIRKEPPIRRSDLFYFFAMGVLLLISVIIERRFFHYHFVRAFIPFCFFVGLGIEEIYRKLREAFQSGDWYAKVVLVALIIGGFVFTPILRYLWVITPAVYFYTAPAKYENSFQSNDGIHNYKLHREVARLLDETVSRDSLALVIATGGNPINYYRAGKPHSKFSHFAFIIAAPDGSQWRKEFSEELSRAAALAISTDDVDPIVTGFDGSSLDWITKSDYWEYINTHFSEARRIGSYFIYYRISAN